MEYIKGDLINSENNLVRFYFVFEHVYFHLGEKMYSH